MRASRRRATWARIFFFFFGWEGKRKRRRPRSAHRAASTFRACGSVPPTAPRRAAFGAPPRPPARSTVTTSVSPCVSGGDEAHGRRVWRGWWVATKKKVKRCGEGGRVAPFFVLVFLFTHAHRRRSSASCGHGTSSGSDTTTRRRGGRLRVFGRATSSARRTRAGPRPPPLPLIASLSRITTHSKHAPKTAMTISSRMATGRRMAVCA